MFSTRCFDVWREEEESPKIITLCKGLDRCLGGGIGTRLITEFCGGPGTGKTQLCLQLCINVQMPKNVGGVNGKALYIDTNQGLNPMRLSDMANCMHERFYSTLYKPFSHTFDKNPVTVAALLSNIKYIYCENYVELLAIVTNLRLCVQQETQLKLVVIDSFSFLMRCIEDVSERTRTVLEILTDLQKMAVEYQLAIVITNELTTRAFGSDWLVHPTLGDSHAHKVNQRIILSRDQSSKIFRVIVDKSVVAPKECLHFQIMKSGIRGMDS